MSKEEGGPTKAFEGYKAHRHRIGKRLAQGSERWGKPGGCDQGWVKNLGQRRRVANFVSQSKWQGRTEKKGSASETDEETPG